MGRRRRIPGVLDILIVDDLREIGPLIDDTRLDRVPPEGPIANRIIVRRIRGLLRIGPVPLPTMVSRRDEDRRQAQRMLGDRLNAAAADVGTIPDGDMTAIVDYIRGGDDRDSAGMAIQALVGRQFSPDYRADPGTFRSAALINESLASRNLLRWLVDWLSGRTRRARDRLSARVGGDPAALHATMVAFQNLLVTADRMRDLFNEPRSQSIGAAAALARCLVAPETILREATRRADTIAGSLSRGTLVAFDLRKATDNTLLPGAGLLDAHWSGCPASAYVKALVIEIWRRAQAREAAS